MPRPLRVSVAGGIHHVINRCNHRAQLLSPSDLHDCYSLLLTTKQRFGLRFFGYALLHNHYHLVLQEPARGTLGQAMHWFNGTAAVRFNLRHDLAGHLWQGRFKNRLLENTERDFLQCLIYVDLNPARAGLAPRITDWRYCSARTHAEGTQDPLLDPTPISLTGYRDILHDAWAKTQQLRQALQRHDREAVRSCLRQASSRTYIPYPEEIARMAGRNFRRLIQAS